MLDDKAYDQSFEELPVISAGHMNFIHGHISNSLGILSENSVTDEIHISNYFSDALLGWSCISPKENPLIGYQKMVNEVNLDLKIPEKIKTTACG